MSASQDIADRVAVAGVVGHDAYGAALERQRNAGPAPNGPFPEPARLPPPSARATRALREYVPHLSLAERDRRWSALREAMSRENLDALVLLGNDIFWGAGMANLHYLFQIDSQCGGKGLFCIDGEPAVWNSPPHMNRPTNYYALRQDWVSDIRIDVGLSHVVEEIAARGLERGRLGMVGFSSAIQTTTTLLHEDAEALRRLLPGATWVDATPLVQGLRVVKSEEEIGHLRRAGRIARMTLDAMAAASRPGVPEAEVYAEMIRTQIANGADPLVFNLFAAGPVDHPESELWHMLHGCEAPATPTLRPLAHGDLVVAEWHTKYGGYRCHTEYTVYVGDRAPDELRRLWEVGVECLEASETALVAGRTLREAWEIVREPARRHGVDWVELGFHAMGVASPEFPTVVYEEGYGAPTLNGTGIGDLVLEEGMTFGNNIDLHDSTWKVDVGIMLSDFMVVRPDRAECLVGTPRELAQVG
jgi:Xaa-Pro aminopeptidase